MHEPVPSNEHEYRSEEKCETTHEDDPLRCLEFVGGCGNHARCEQHDNQTGAREYDLHKQRNVVEVARTEQLNVVSRRIRFTS